MQKNADRAKQLYTRAFPGLLKLSEGDDPNAQWLLGASFNVGRGVEKDQAKAVEWFRKSAEQGNAVAQRLIGQCYLEGEGVEKDQAQAVEWFSKSAQQGNAVAQGLLGWLYLRGEVVEKDQTKAVEWFSKSAEQGNATSQWYLAWRYMSGEGVEKDQAHAVEWFRKSAEQGNADAQLSVGYCYDKGEGVAKNSSEAAKWYLKSAEQGNKQAMRNLAYMEGSTLDASEKNLWLYRAAESDKDFHGGPETKDVMALTVGGQLRNVNQPPKGLITMIKEGLSGEFKTRRLRSILRAEPRENSGRKVYPVRLVFEGPDGGEERWDLIFFKDEFDQWSAETAKNDVPS
jgi:TPR repeat protein